jgi:CubicO group peptidase (beta-lactamase class C family)
MSYKLKAACLRCGLFVLSLLFCRAVLAQSDFGAVDQLIKQNQKALGNFVALVWKDGKILYQKQGGTDFTPKTTAPIGAAANWMTAALVMTFVDEGKLSLDDRVVQYIPLFGKYSKSYITIRHCLTNTTGIRAEGKTKFESLEEEINSYASKRDIVANPGTEFYYSYVGPKIIARVLEIISKKSFERLMQERIIRPLKMRSTSFTNEEGGPVDPAGGARSSANDYISFLSMLLDKGVFEGRRILSEKAVEELEASQFGAIPVKSGPKGLQGFHFSLGSYIMESSAAGKTNVLACPNMEGTIPYIDKCRNYAAILITEKREEEKKPLYQSLKGLIDGAVGGGGCQ